MPVIIRPPAPPDPLPPKLAAVLLRLATRMDLNMTKAVKLPYLVDVVANRILGRPITEGHHETWTLGVVTSEAWRYLDRSPFAESPLLTVEPLPFSEEKRVRANAEMSGAALTPGEREVVDFVAQQFAGIWAVDLGTMTKAMNPHVPREAWGSNRPADIGPDAFDRMSPDYQAMATSAVAYPLSRMRRDSRRIAAPEDALA